MPDSKQLTDRLIDLSGDDWPQQLGRLLESDPALCQAFLRHYTMTRFLSALHGVANQLPTLAGAPHQQPADTRHTRADIGAALALADEMPADMRAAVRQQLRELRDMATAHNLAVHRWREAVRDCYARLSPLCVGRYHQVATTLSMQVMDLAEQAERATQAEQMLSAALAIAAQLPDDLDDDDRAGDADSEHASSAIAVERQAATSEAAPPDVGPGSHVRRLQWTVGVISCLAAVLILSFGFMTLQAEDRAQTARADATEARERARRATQPVLVQIGHNGNIREVWQFPTTIQVAGKSVTLSKAPR